MVSCKKMLGYRVGAFAIYQSVEIQYTQKHGWQKSTIGYFQAGLRALQIPS